MSNGSVEPALRTEATTGFLFMESSVKMRERGKAKRRFFIRDAYLARFHAQAIARRREPAPSARPPAST